MTDEYLAAAARDPTLAGQPFSAIQGHLGYWIVEWDPGYCVIRMPVRDVHLNRAGAVHGGVYSTLIDAACGFAVAFDRAAGSLRDSATLALTTSYIRGVGDGVLRVVGRDRGGGGRVRISTGEVYDDAGALLATGDCTYRLFSSASPLGGG